MFFVYFHPLSIFLIRYTEYMEQHPIPRQITSFEFKLIGFMTLHQFLYLVVFVPVAFIVYKIIPIPFINILFGLLTVAAGCAFAFLPVNDRPLDIFLKNLWKRLQSPTQYTYHKDNPPILVLQNLYFVSDPHKVMAHIESKEKLAAYLAKTKPIIPQNQNKQNIQSLLQKPTPQLAPAKPVAGKPVVTAAKTGTPVTPNPVAPRMVESPTHPFLLGVIKNNKKIPLPGVLIYVKDTSNKPIRLLKTNPHGIFASFHPLPAGEYTIEAKDSKGGYFFDTMKLSITNEQPKQIEIFSKELL